MNKVEQIKFDFSHFSNILCSVSSWWAMKIFWWVIKNFLRDFWYLTPQNTRLNIAMWSRWKPFTREQQIKMRHWNGALEDIIYYRSPIKKYFTHSSYSRRERLCVKSNSCGPYAQSKANECPSSTVESQSEVNGIGTGTTSNYWNLEQSEKWWIARISYFKFYVIKSENYCNTHLDAFVVTNKLYNF